MEAVASKEGLRASLRGAPPNRLAAVLRDARDIEIPPTTPLVGKVLGGFAPGRRVIPFVNIGFNLSSIGTEYSPAGFLRVLSPTLSVEAKSDAIAKAALGSLLYWHLSSKAAQGELTGPWPSDPNERDEWRREGRQASSYTVGRNWIPFDRVLGPMAVPAKWVSGINDAWQEAQGKPFTAEVVANASGKVAGALATSVIDSTFFIGPDQLIRAGQTISRGDVLGGATDYLGEQVASQIPFSGGLRSVAQSTDPYVRRTRGFAAEIEAVIPGLSENLPASTSYYGQPIRRQDAERGISGVVNPIRATREQRDPIDQELMQHTLFGGKDAEGNPTTSRALLPSLARTTIASYSLTAEEGQSLREIAGRATHQALADLFSGKAKGEGEEGPPKTYSEMTEREKVANIERVIGDAHRTARSVVADTIMQRARTDSEIERAAEMRLSTISKVSERAAFLVGLERQGKLTEAVKKYLNEHRRGLGTPSVERTIEQYLRMGRGL